MTKDGHRLAPALRLAQRREDEAARLLGQWQARVRQHAGQLQELRRYRQEYRERWERHAAAGLTASQLRDYLRFLERLDAALSAQAARLVELEAQRDRQQREWRAAHARVEALEQVIQRDLTAWLRERDLREQEQADERAQRGSPFGWKD